MSGSVLTAQAWGLSHELWKGICKMDLLSSTSFYLLASWSSVTGWASVVLSISKKRGLGEGREEGRLDGQVGCGGLQNKDTHLPFTKDFCFLFLLKLLFPQGKTLFVCV